MRKSKSHVLLDLLVDPGERDFATHEFFLRRIAEKKSQLAEMLSYLKSTTDITNLKRPGLRVVLRLEEEIAKLEAEDKQLLLEAERRNLLLCAKQSQISPGLRSTIRATPSLDPAVQVEALSGGRGHNAPSNNDEETPRKASGTKSLDKQPTATQLGRLELGKTIADLYDELLRLKMCSRGRRKTEEELRTAFPEFKLWREIDESGSLPALKRSRFFQARLDSYGQKQLMDFIGNIIAHEGGTAYTIWKQYRKHAGLNRKRKPSKRNPKADPLRVPKRKS